MATVRAVIPQTMPITPVTTVTTKAKWRKNMPRRIYLISPTGVPNVTPAGIKIDL
jgi:hypothetical protein